MSESAKRPPSPNSPPEVENKEEGGMFLTPVAAAPEKKRCSRNSTFVVQGNSSPSKDKSSGDEIVLLLFSKIVRGSLELIWCERNSGEVDGFTDPLAKAITEDEHSSSSQSTTGKNVAHRHGIFMYGSRVKPGNRTLWMNAKGYPRRFYIRQMRDGDDRLAVLNDVCQFLQAKENQSRIEKPQKPLHNVYLVPSDWDRTPSQLERLDEGVSEVYVLNAIRAIFSSSTNWNTFGTDYPEDLDDFLTKPYSEHVKNLFGIQSDLHFNSSYI